MSFQTINLTIADQVGTITINRPDNANALNRQMASELHEAAIQLTTDPNVRAILLTATGKMFCAGGDLQEMEDAGGGKETLLTRMASDLHGALIRFAQANQPLVIAVNGTAAGGGFSMALAGDVVIASERAKFVSAYTASGLTPDGSSTYFLAKHVGLLRAKELLLTNRLLTASEAMDWGLVTKVVSPDDLMSEAGKIAKDFAQGPTLAYGNLKRMLTTAYSDTMETQLDRETRSIAGMMRTEDAPNGLSSFLKKETPTFKGR
ncbi:MAG: enoyl-CoA hydratase-related protein [Pseudomonadota bacterium]